MKVSATYEAYLRLFTSLGHIKPYSVCPCGALIEYWYLVIIGMTVGCPFSSMFYLMVGLFETHYIFELSCAISVRRLIRRSGYGMWTEGNVSTH